MDPVTLLKDFGLLIAILAGIGMASGVTWCALVYVLPKRNPKMPHPYFIYEEHDSWSDQ